jgi:hypothetical protein
MRIKISQGGTAQSGASLCHSCSNAVVVRGSKTNEELVHCHSLDRDMGMQVAECSAYRNAAQASLVMMKEIAWTLDPSKRGSAGFTSPAQRNKDRGDTPLVSPDGEVHW